MRNHDHIGVSHRIGRIGAVKEAALMRCGKSGGRIAIWMRSGEILLHHPAAQVVVANAAALKEEEELLAPLDEVHEDPGRLAIAAAHPVDGDEMPFTVTGDIERLARFKAARAPKCL